ncbi:MAG: sialate O-acetylesterase [Eubacteriales bacterium]
MRIRINKNNIGYIKPLLFFLLCVFSAFLLVACGNMDGEKLNRAITMDDNAYKIEVAEDGSYFVRMPAGRPRVPVLSCESGEVVTQPFFSDGMDSSMAKVEIDDSIYAIKFIKDSKLGFELQYDDRYKFMPKDIKATSFKSSNTNVAEVDDLGNIKIVGVSDSGVTISATDGINTEELRITKTVRAPLSVYMLTGQSNGAYYYPEPENAAVTRPGTAYHYSELASGIRIESMNSEAGTMDRGNIEPALAKELYSRMGEKVLVVNSGVSGQKIETFVPIQGVSYQNIDRVWQIVCRNLDDKDFKSKYEVRLRSYIWVQGESDPTTDVAIYKSDFMKLHQMLRSSDYGFDYGFIVKVREKYKNAALAQEDLTIENEDIAMATRQTETFSVKDGTMRSDDTHYSQMGDNIIGEDTAKTIVKAYLDGVDSVKQDLAVGKRSTNEAI